MTTRFLAAAICVAALSGPATPTPRPKDAKELVYYAAKGTELVYKTPAEEFTDVVTAVEDTKDGKLIRVGRAQPAGEVKAQDVLLAKAEALYLLEETGQKYDPPWCFLKAGAKPG